MQSTNNFAHCSKYMTSKGSCSIHEKKDDSYGEHYILPAVNPKREFLKSVDEIEDMLNRRDNLLLAILKKSNRLCIP